MGPKAKSQGSPAATFIGLNLKGERNMAKKSRRFLALVLTLILAFSLLPISGIADGGTRKIKISIAEFTNTNKKPLTITINNTAYNFEGKGNDGKFESTDAGIPESAISSGSFTADVTYEGNTYRAVTFTAKNNGNTSDNSGNGTDLYEGSTTPTSPEPDDNSNTIPVKIYILNPAKAVPADGADLGAGNYYPSANDGVYASNIPASLSDSLLAQLKGSNANLDIGDTLLVTDNSGIDMTALNDDVMDTVKSAFGLTGNGEYTVTAYVIKVQRAHDYIGSSGNNWYGTIGSDKADIHVDCYLARVPATVTYHTNYDTDIIFEDSNGSNLYTGDQYTVLGYADTKLPTRNGYTFMGWTADSAGNGKVYSASDTFLLAGNTDLYAKWQANAPTLYSYTVEHYLVGAATPFDTVSVTDVSAGTTVTSVADSAKLAAGYTRDHTDPTVISAVINNNSTVIKVYYSMKMGPEVPGSATLTINKTDGTNLITEGSATFALTDSADKSKVYNVETVKGIAKFVFGNENSNQIPAGTYTLAETAAPAGYTKTSDTWTVKVTKSFDIKLSDGQTTFQKVWNWVIGDGNNGTFENNTLTVANSKTKYSVNINLNTKDLGGNAYSKAASFTKELTLDQVDQFVASQMNSYAFNGVSFFARDGKSTRYALNNPSYVGITADSKEYGLDGKTLPELSAADKLTAELQKNGSATLDYYFTQIVHYGVDNGYSSVADISDVSQIFTTTTNTGVTVNKTLADTNNLYLFKGWKLNGTAYTVSNDPADSVLVKNSATLNETVKPVVKTVNGIGQLWYNFVSVWDKNDGNTVTLSYTVEYYKDGILDPSKTVTVTENSWKGDNKTTISVNKGSINETDAFGSGYSFEKSDPTTLPDTIANNGVIKVYYTRDAGTLTIGKSFGQNNQYTANTTFSLAVTGPDGYNKDVTVKAGEKVTLTVPTGSYIVTEKDAKVASYTLTTTGSGASYSVTKGNDTLAAIVNTYTYQGGYDPTVPPTTPPTTDITDPDVPTTDIPDPETPTTDITDPETPKADASQQVTGDELVLWIALACMSAMALVYIIVVDKKRKDNPNK